MSFTERGTLRVSPFLPSLDFSDFTLCSPALLTVFSATLRPAAAALEAELTLPEISQSLVLTRTSGRASTMPPGETLENFARSEATLAIHLSIHQLEKVVTELTPFYGAHCPVAIVYRASWPDQFCMT